MSCCCSSSCAAFWCVWPFTVVLCRFVSVDVTSCCCFGCSLLCVYVSGYVLEDREAVGLGFLLWRLCGAVRLTSVCMSVLFVLV
uniref:Secreted protein n=1 Tax=Anopheles darlingi TaxID=43151 RepID=A0A2M4D316_ANODA